jgi:hypothetical protein
VKKCEVRMLLFSIKLCVHVFKLFCVNYFSVDRTCIRYL